MLKIPRYFAAFRMAYLSGLKNSGRIHHLFLVQYNYVGDVAGY